MPLVHSAGQDEGALVEAQQHRADAQMRGQMATTLADAGAVLVVAVWGCIGVRLGFGVGQGGRHLAAHLGVSAMLLGLYQGALVLAG